MPFVADNQSENTSVVQPKKSLGSKLFGFGKEVVDRAFNFPSQVAGGILKSGTQVKEGTYKSPETGIKVPKWLGGKSGQYDVGELIQPQIVGAFRGAKEKPSVMNELPTYVGVDPESPAGIGIGLAGEIATPDIADLLTAGKVGKKIISKFGEKTGKLGENIAEAGIKPTKTQRESFLKATKKTIGKYVADNKLAGNLAENLTQKLDAVQGEFDDIAINSGIKISPVEIETGINKAKSKLNKIIDKSEIKALDDLKDDLIKEGRNFDIAELTDMRKRLDSKIPDSQWQKLLGGEAVSKNVEKRMAIQEMIQEVAGDVKSASGKTLKELGKELMPMYKLGKIVGLQEGVSVAGRVGGLGDIASFGAGFTQGDTAEERFLNGLKFIIGRRVISNPRVLSETAKLPIKVGEVLEKPGLIQSFAQKGLQAGKEALLSPFRKQEEPPIKGATPGFIPD